MIPGKKRIYVGVLLFAIVLFVTTFASCSPEPSAEDVSTTIAAALEATQTTEAQINNEVATAVAVQLPTETAPASLTPTLIPTDISPSMAPTNTPDPGPLITILSPQAGQDATVGEAIDVQLIIEDKIGIDMVSVLIMEAIVQELVARAGSTYSTR